MKVEYSSNNSGGTWWLKDEDWRALERAGWTVEWADGYVEKVYRDKPDKNGVVRYMGALAKRATGEFKTLEDAKRSFYKVTGQDPTDKGCSCCGPPHNFYTD